MRLNPSGNNQLNFREVRRLLNPPPVESSDDGSGADEPIEEGRRGAIDDYDYDDDFIDDGALDGDDDYLEEPYDEDADDDFVPQQSDSEAENQAPATADPSKTAENAKAHAMQTNTIHHGFGRFFVNRGEIPAISKMKPLPTPPNPVGNVIVEFPASIRVSMSSSVVDNTTKEKQQPKSKPKDNAGKKGGATSNVKQTPEKGQGSSGTSVAVVAKKKPSDTGSTSGNKSNGKGIPLHLSTEVHALSNLVETEFGDKKPKIQDPKVQDQLAVIFREALACGVAKLFSDIQKDKRIIQLSEELWNRLSRFMRTKRSTLETLGHALHWRSKEIEAQKRVETTEQSLELILEAQRSAWMNVDSAETKVGHKVEWTRTVDEAMYDWYQARSHLQMAKNQLGSRSRSVKKSAPAWVSSLKLKSFTGFTVSEQEITDSYRRIEEERAAKERQKRDLERLERKRKREEAAAAVAAKKQALANAKAVATKIVPSNGTPLNNQPTPKDPQQNKDTTPKVKQEASLQKTGTPKSGKNMNKNSAKATPAKLTQSKLTSKSNNKVGKPSKPNGNGSAAPKHQKSGSITKKSGKESGGMKKITPVKIASTKSDSKGSNSSGGNGKSGGAPISKGSKQNVSGSKGTGSNKQCSTGKGGVGGKSPAGSKANSGVKTAKNAKNGNGKGTNSGKTGGKGSNGKNSTGKGGITKQLKTNASQNKGLVAKGSEGRNNGQKSSTGKGSGNNKNWSGRIGVNKTSGVKSSGQKGSGNKTSVKHITNKTTNTKPYASKQSSDGTMGKSRSANENHDSATAVKGREKRSGISDAGFEKMTGNVDAMTECRSDAEIVEVSSSLNSRSEVMSGGTGRIAVVGSDATGSRNGGSGKGVEVVKRMSVSQLVIHDVPDEDIGCISSQRNMTDGSLGRHEEDMRVSGNTVNDGNGRNEKVPVINLD